MTVDRLVEVLTPVAAVGSGVVAGLFLAFSVAVMPALGRLPAAHGAATMQSVNATIRNPVFGLVFGGTTATCLVLAVAAPIAGQPGAIWRAVGALLYLLGALLVTIVRNVPLNEELAAVDPAAPAAVGVWDRYRSRWTAWNHLRTLTAVAASGVLSLVG